MWVEIFMGVVTGWHFHGQHLVKILEAMGEPVLVEYSKQARSIAGRKKAKVKWHPLNALHHNTCGTTP